MSSSHPVLEGLLSDTRPVVERLLDEAPIPLEQLVLALEAFDESIEAVRLHPMVDAHTADLLSRACRSLLVEVADHPEQHALAQVAVRYVVLDEDADGDTDSPFGFDDDVEVFNAVVEHLGRGHLALT